MPLPHTECKEIIEVLIMCLNYNKCELDYKYD